jgi:hypothetical protein
MAACESRIFNFSLKIKRPFRKYLKRDEGINGAEKSQFYQVRIVSIVDMGLTTGIGGLSSCLISGVESLNPRA